MSAKTLRQSDARVKDFEKMRKSHDRRDILASAQSERLKI